MAGTCGIPPAGVVFLPVIQAALLSSGRSNISDLFGCLQQQEFEEPPHSTSFSCKEITSPIL
jgi:hypothetical protein